MIGQLQQLQHIRGFKHKHETLLSMASFIITLKLEGVDIIVNDAALI